MARWGAAGGGYLGRRPAGCVNLRADARDGPARGDPPTDRRGPARAIADGIRADAAARALAGATPGPPVALQAGAGSAAPEAERRPPLLVADAAAALVLVALGGGLPLGPRARQVGVGDRHGQHGRHQLPDRAGRSRAAVWAGSRVLDR